MDWLMIPLLAVLNRLGGSVDKRYRRIGIGVALALFGLLHSVAWYWCLAVVLANYLITILPITLTGDEIDGALDWAWILFLGCLLGLCPALLNLHYFALAFPFGAIYFALVWLSNFKPTAEIFKWQYVELAVGALIGLEAILIL